MSNLMTIAQASAELGVSKSFLLRKCQSGELPAIRVGKVYRVHPDDLAGLQRAMREVVTRPGPMSAARTGNDILERIDAWIAYLTNVRALSPATVSLYQGMLRNHLRRMSALGHERLSLETVFERKTLMAVFAKIPARSFNLKYNTYIALRSFGKFLQEEGRFPAETLDGLRSLKPRRFGEPRRTHLKQDEVARFFDIILTRSLSPVENVTFAALTACMVYAGLRVTEVCKLRPKDVDLDARVLEVVDGKGGKTRRVGIGNSLYAALKEYQAVRANGSHYFCHMDGRPYNRYQVTNRMKEVSRRLSVDITSHGLRRTFATLAANQGRSVNAIRIALGHSDLTTTQAYLRTTECEVVESMKDW